MIQSSVPKLSSFSLQKRCVSALGEHYQSLITALPINIEAQDHFIESLESHYSIKQKRRAMMLN
jgi:hypothetical protein